MYIFIYMCIYIYIYIHITGLNNINTYKLLSVSCFRNRQALDVK